MGGMVTDGELIRNGVPDDLKDRAPAIKKPLGEEEGDFADIAPLDIPKRTFPCHPVLFAYF